MWYMNELGAVLRAWRDRLDPAAVELTNASPRRVAGLRRSELATLAGISVEYVARLEQGRAATPSVQVCAPLDANVLTTQNTDLRLVVLTPRPGTGAREKLDQLA
jgi:transcriptional regulator with XRE-family HTH domain